MLSGELSGGQKRESWMAPGDVDAVVSQLGATSFENGAGPVGSFYGGSEHPYGEVYTMASRWAMEDHFDYGVNRTEPEVRSNALRIMGVKSEAVPMVIEQMRTEQ